MQQTGGLLLAGGRPHVVRTAMQQTGGLLLAGLVALTFALGAVEAGAQGSDYRMTILHSSENHGHWEPYTQTVSLGGIARRATLVKQIRAEGGNSLLVDAGGVPVKWDGDPTVVDASIAADPAVEALRQKLAEPLTTARLTVIGKNVLDLDGQASTLRSQESALGNLVADAMLEATRADNTQVALMNGSGVRTSLKAGDITVGGVLEVLPFGNRLVQMGLKGSELLAALENGVSRVSEGAGRFPQVAGLRFAYDVSRPAGQRVTGVEIGAFGSGFQPLDLGATYRVVVNDFMAGGGDGYESLLLGTNVQGGDVPLDNVLMDYIRARGTIEPRVEGRIAAGTLGPLTQSSQPALPPAAGASPTTVPPERTAPATLALTVPPSRAAPRSTPTPAQAAKLQTTLTTGAAPTAAQPQATPAPTPPATSAQSGGSPTWLCVLVPLGLVIIWGYRRRRRRSPY
jgi:5'-nucleotidase / UDP-sugar diphosphatase